MAQTIKTGTMLIKDGTVLPDELQFESEPCATGWRLVKNLDGHGLGQKIHEAGWSFFYLAGETKATTFGFDGQKTVRRAVKRILVNLKSDEFNGLEITQVETKRFWDFPMPVSAPIPDISRRTPFFCRPRTIGSGTKQSWRPCEPRQ